jgi:hypothetical protein
MEIKMKKVLPVVLMLSNTAFAYEEMDSKVALQALSEITPFSGNYVSYAGPQKIVGKTCSVSYEDMVLTMNNVEIPIQKLKTKAFTDGRDILLEVRYGIDLYQIHFKQTPNGPQLSVSDGKMYYSCEKQK